MSEKWEWWAGRNEDRIEVGPHATKEDAIEEALSNYHFTEIDPEGEEGWRRGVYVVEACGLYYDCDECGSVPEICQECRDNLDEYVMTFGRTRNAEWLVLDYPDPSS